MTKKQRKLTTEETKDMELVKQIKPKLQKYLIKQQRQTAEKVAKEKQADDKKMMADNEAIKQATRIAMLAIFDKKVWQQVPPYLEWKWLKDGTDKPETAREMHSDIAGFTTYLIREYNQFLKLQFTEKGYPHPLQEQNILFFWTKFNKDLKLLIEVEMKRVKSGNSSIILGKVNSTGQVENIKKRLIN